MFKTTLRLARPLVSQTITTTSLLIRSHALKPLARPFSSESLCSSKYLHNLQNTQDALSHEVLELNKRVAYLDGKTSVNLPNSNNLPTKTPPTNPDLSALTHEIAKLHTKLQEQASAHSASSRKINNTINDGLEVVSFAGILGVVVATLWGVDAQNKS